MNETAKELASATIQRLSNAGYSGAIIETYQAAYNSLVRQLVEKVCLPADFFM